MKNRIINVQDVTNFNMEKQELDDYVCITDIAKAKTGESRSADVVKNWLRNSNAFEFLGTWEMIYNVNIKVVKIDHFKSEAGLHTFVLSVAEWINKTNAIGLYVKRMENMAVHMRIKTLPLNLRLQSVRFLNCI